MSGRAVPPLATIKTVAAHAGVSVSAVSKVLRNAYGVSDGLREKVQLSIDALDYRPSSPARSMRGHSSLVGVLVKHIDAFATDVAAGIASVFERTEFVTMVALGGDSMGEMDQAQAMVDRKMAGAIVVSPESSLAFLSNIADDMPTVVIGWPTDDVTNFDVINPNIQGSVGSAIKSLIELGCDSVLMIAEGHDGTHTSALEVSFQKLMSERGLSAANSVIRPPSDPATRGDFLALHLAAQTKKLGAICTNDRLAIDLLAAAANVGVTVPDELAVVGYGNTPVSGLSLVELSTIDPRPYELGALAAAALLARVGGRLRPERVHLEAELIVRRSSKPFMSDHASPHKSHTRLHTTLQEQP